MAEAPDEVTGTRESQTPSHSETSTMEPSVEHIRAQIGQTRAGMSDTVDAIQERLSPSRVLTNAKKAVADATVGRVKGITERSVGALRARRSDFNGRAVLNAVEDNPIAAALGGLAAAGLIVSGRRAFITSRNRDPQIGSSFDTPRSYWPLLVGACAGVVCWSAWTGRVPFARSFSTGEDADLASYDAVPE